VPKALERYGEVADALGLGGKTKEEKVRGWCWFTVSLCFMQARAHCCSL
jgi:hypothetical protein